MDADALLLRLGGVRRSSSRDGWSAKCPAHKDRSPSLSVKALPDGRILLHCFAGCDTDAVLSAIGLSLTDLFPEPLGVSLPRIRPAFTAMDALRALTRESGIVAIAAADIAEGKKLNAEDASRVCLATGRIADALEFIHDGG